MQRIGEWLAGGAVALVMFLPIIGAAATYRPPASSIANDSITSAKITDATIVNADVSATANIVESKIKFNGQTLTFPVGVGAASTTLENNGSGLLTWAPRVHDVTPYFATTTGFNQVNIPVKAGDTIQMWWNGYADSGGSNCGSTVKQITASYKQSTYAATTTVETPGDGAGSSSFSCSASASYMITATTTETISVAVNNDSMQRAAVMAQRVR